MYQKTQIKSVEGISPEYKKFVESQFSESVSPSVFKFVRIDDSNKPGIIESGKFVIQGKIYKGTYWHNSNYQKLEKLSRRE